MKWESNARSQGELKELGEEGRYDCVYRFTQ